MTLKKKPAPITSTVSRGKPGPKPKAEIDKVLKPSVSMTPETYRFAKAYGHGVLSAGVEAMRRELERSHRLKPVGSSDHDWAHQRIEQLHSTLEEAIAFILSMPPHPKLKAVATALSVKLDEPVGMGTRAMVGESYLPTGQLLFKAEVFHDQLLVHTGQNRTAQRELVEALRHAGLVTNLKRLPDSAPPSELELRLADTRRSR